MKKNELTILDKISIGIIILNILSFIITFIFGNSFYNAKNILEMIIAILMMYTVFGIPGMSIIGLILNTITLVRKNKKDIKNNINIIIYVIFIILIPIWWQFFINSLMGV